ncbi:MAG: hypothetical protein ACD_79C01490G0001 [uncultured bacterium]|nr:MAG: hypothetical protein ACD_79C01490G0001 [uncultured bacterium]
MIKSFKNKETENLFNDVEVLKYKNIERVARRKLYLLNSVKTLNELRVPPGNRLEALEGNRKGQYSIRINDQWRICFNWKEMDSFNVEITDYH